MSSELAPDVLPQWSCRLRLRLWGAAPVEAATEQLEVAARAAGLPYACVGVSDTLYGDEDPYRYVQVNYQLPALAAEQAQLRAREDTEHLGHQLRQGGAELELTDGPELQPLPAPDPRPPRL